MRVELVRGRHPAVFGEFGGGDTLASPSTAMDVDGDARPVATTPSRVQVGVRGRDAAFVARVAADLRDRAALPVGAGGALWRPPDGCGGRPREPRSVQGRWTVDTFQRPWMGSAAQPLGGGGG